MILNPIVWQVLEDRVRTCVASGLCECTSQWVSPDCPCHNVDPITFNDTERAIAPDVIAAVRAEEGKNVV